MEKMASLIKFFKAYGYDNYTTDGFDLARRVRIKGTRIGVIIYDDVVVPYYYAFGKYHCGYARSIDLYDESAHAFYLRVIEAYGDKVVMF